MIFDYYQNNLPWIFIVDQDNQSDSILSAEKKGLICYTSRCFVIYSYFLKHAMVWSIIILQSRGVWWRQLDYYLCDVAPCIAEKRRRYSKKGKKESTHRLRSISCTYIYIQIICTNRVNNLCIFSLMSPFQVVLLLYIKPVVLIQSARERRGKEETIT